MFTKEKLELASGSDGERLHKFGQQGCRNRAAQACPGSSCDDAISSILTHTIGFGACPAPFPSCTGSGLAILLSPLWDGHCVSLKGENMFLYLDKGSQGKGCLKSQWCWNYGDIEVVVNIVCIMK